LCVSIFPVAQGIHRGYKGELVILIGIQNDFQSAVNRACDNQHNKCADVANSNKKGSLTVGDCDTQNSELARRE